jgi:hypothetical protein
MVVPQSHKALDRSLQIVHLKLEIAGMKYALRSLSWWAATRQLHPSVEHNRPTTATRQKPTPTVAKECQN